MSEFSRETLLNIIETDHVQCGEASALARMALAAMDDEPVAIIDQANIDYLRSGADADVWPPEREEMGDVLLYRHPQPAPVVPELMVDWQENEFSAGWNACRAAMLQELKKSAGTKAICRSDENVQVLHTKSPAQSDCCPAQNHVSPEQNGDTPAQSQGWIQVSERMPPSRHEVLVGRWWGEKPRWCCKWATYIPGHPDAQSSGWLIPGASWTPTHWVPLPAAPQEVK
ncbi:TPA: DUF551 domain-containing protein [Klebsiella pneumoniae]|uniref:DUF551 domain-containing protein n=1 Tax=Klebsiella pneumoniae TaxID=573 RepID=UPI0023589806|nr:DUF551 domain-containing protein [Klebsiella pneumoniae]MDC8515692.1 DUF551 domain-containing protein [Klebsiella pneumoniae]HBQ1671410.1 DUF551 domain-containing protein [Klebsiella pneumoniae]HBT6138786.1 DUF551 domain-containing protein [Klebsiella pneumoniae]HBV7654564.1 DUF551 domain-containing protein [Klebsiella pneumoniae]HBW6057489.1 DUF551 domain-containing protein [Klebsiella pneumoniae]